MDVQGCTIADYAIKRKRKRAHTAVDPCLGYYISSFSHSSPVALPKSSKTVANPEPIFITDNSSSNLPSHPHPVALSTSRINILSVESTVPPNCAPEAVITVEEFLQRSARKPVKSYARRNRRLANLHDTELQKQVFSDDEEADYQPKRPFKRRRISTAASSISPNSPLTKKTKNLRYKKDNTFTRRIIRAAVLSHVEPTESLIRQNNPRLPRIPLQFVPLREGSPVSNPTVKTEPRTLVDPRKASQFNLTYFSPCSQRRLPTLKTTENLAITRLNDTSVETPRVGKESRFMKTKALTSEVINRAFSRLPLSFVPLRDAEAAHTLKLHSTKLGLTHTTGDTGTPIEQHIIPPERPPLSSLVSPTSPFGPHLGPPSLDCPLYLHVTRSVVASPISSSPSILHASTPNLAPDPESFTVTLNGFSVADTALDHSDPIMPLNGVPSDISAVNSGNIYSARPSQASSIKPLEGLSYYLQDLLKTARTAVQMQPTTPLGMDKKAAKRRPRATGAQKAFLQSDATLFNTSFKSTENLKNCTDLQQIDFRSLTSIGPLIYSSASNGIISGPPQGSYSTEMRPFNSPLTQQSMNLSLPSSSTIVSRLNVTNSASPDRSAATTVNNAPS